MAQPAVSVVVPARDARDTLPRALAALAGQRLELEFEVIVVDDGSGDGTAELARSAGPPVRTLTQPPLGPAAARNRGVREARAPLLAFCDADVFPTPGWLEAGVRALGGADLVQGRVLPDPGAPLGPFDRTIWVTFAPGLWEAANLFATRELFDRVGGFEQWLRPRRGKALAEDVWFGYRAMRLGATVAFAPEALAHHAVFRRSRRGYVAERARLRYFPAMASRTPELRRTFLHRRLFLNRRTARLDLALAAALAARMSRSPWPLLATAPYLRAVWTQAARGGPSPARAAVATIDLAADALGALALAYGSARYRSVIL